MTSDNKRYLFIRGLDNDLTQRLEQEANLMGLSKNKLACLLLEKELKKTHIQIELEELTQLKESMRHMTEVFHEFIELHTQLLHLMQGEDESYHETT